MWALAAFWGRRLRLLVRAVGTRGGCWALRIVDEAPGVGAARARAASSHGVPDDSAAQATAQRGRGCVRSPRAQRALLVLARDHLRVDGAGLHADGAGGANGALVRAAWRSIAQADMVLPRAVGVGRPAAVGPAAIESGMRRRCRPVGRAPASRLAGGSNAARRGAGLGHTPGRLPGRNPERNPGRNPGRASARTPGQAPGAGAFAPRSRTVLRRRA